MDDSKSSTEQTSTSQKSTITVLRNRVLSGFLLALPIFLTFVIVSWLYNRIVKLIFGPIYSFVVNSHWARDTVDQADPDRENLPEQGAGPQAQVAEDSSTGIDLVAEGLPFWMEYIIAPIMTVAIMLAILFMLGMFFQSRLHRAFDWVMLHVPVVNWIYSVVLKVVNTLQARNDSRPKFQRVVLVEFPHPGTKVPAFVTGSCIDKKTEKTILCIYVPTTPIPTSGYMLLVPEEDVVELDWDLQETLEAIVSGGVTAPDRVDYYRSGQLLSE